MNLFYSRSSSFMSFHWYLLIYWKRNYLHLASMYRHATYKHKYICSALLQMIIKKKILIFGFFKFSFAISERK